MLTVSSGSKLVESRNGADLTTVLADELEIGMRLLGVTSLDQLRPEMVNAQRLLNEMWRPHAISTKSRL